jgi:hypothetical protein
MWLRPRRNWLCCMVSLTLSLPLQPLVLQPFRIAVLIFKLVAETLSVRDINHAKLRPADYSLLHLAPPVLPAHLLPTSLSIPFLHLRSHHLPHIPSRCLRLLSILRARHRHRSEPSHLASLSSPRPPTPLDLSVLPRPFVQTPPSAHPSRSTRRLSRQAPLPSCASQARSRSRARCRAPAR